MGLFGTKISKFVVTTDPTDLWIPGVKEGDPVNYRIAASDIGGGGVTPVRFGVSGEDDIATQDREFNTDTFSFNLITGDTSAFFISNSQSRWHKWQTGTNKQSAVVQYGDASISSGGYDFDNSLNSDFYAQPEYLQLQSQDNSSHQHVIYIDPTVIELYTFGAAQELALQLDNLPAGNSSTDEVLTIDPSTSQVRKIPMITGGGSSLGRFGIEDNIAAEYRSFDENYNTFDWLHIGSITFQSGDETYEVAESEMGMNVNGLYWYSQQSGFKYGDLELDNISGYIDAYNGGTDDSTNASLLIEWNAFGNAPYQSYITLKTDYNDSSDSSQNRETRIQINPASINLFQDIDGSGTNIFQNSAGDATKVLTTDSSGNITLVDNISGGGTTPLPIVSISSSASFASYDNTNADYIIYNNESTPYDDVKAGKSSGIYKWDSTTGDFNGLTGKWKLVAYTNNYEVSGGTRYYAHLPATQIWKDYPEGDLTHPPLFLLLHNDSADMPTGAYLKGAMISGNGYGGAINFHSGFSDSSNRKLRLGIIDNSGVFYDGMEVHYSASGNTLINRMPMTPASNLTQSIGTSTLAFSYGYFGNLQLTNISNVETDSVLYYDAITKEVTYGAASGGGGGGVTSKWQDTLDVAGGSSLTHDNTILCNGTNFELYDAASVLFLSHEVSNSQARYQLTTNFSETEGVFNGDGTDPAESAASGAAVYPDTGSYGGQYPVTPPSNLHSLAYLTAVSGTTARSRITVWKNRIRFETAYDGTFNEYSDNAAAISGGLQVGDIYRTGDVLRIVNSGGGGGGGVGGEGFTGLTATQIAFGDASNKMTSSSNLIYSNSQVTIERDDIGIGSDATLGGLKLLNTQAAVSGTGGSRNSPLLIFDANAWNNTGLTSFPTHWALQNRQNVSAGQGLVIYSGENTTTLTERARFTPLGTFIAASTIFAGGSSGTGTVTANTWSSSSGAVSMNIAMQNGTSGMRWTFAAGEWGRIFNTGDFGWEGSSNDGGVGLTDFGANFFVMSGKGLSSGLINSTTAGTNTVTGTGTRYKKLYKVGDQITIFQVAGGPVETHTITAITSDTSITVDANWTNGFVNQQAKNPDNPTCKFAVQYNGFVGIGVVPDSDTKSLLTINAGTANYVPFKIISSAGVLTTSTVDGAFEYDGTHLYFTIGSTRTQIL